MPQEVSWQVSWQPTQHVAFQPQAPGAPAPQRDHDALALSRPRATLRRGSCGEAVEQLQRRLIAAGYSPGPIDREFGPRTKAAVLRFQRDHGLAPDGVVGPDTWGALLSRDAGRDARSTAPRRATPPPAAPRHTDAVRTRAGQMVRRDGELIAARIAPAYDRMVAAARRDGVRLKIRDGYRSIEEQRILWVRYGRNPNRVARPGHSNHQHGLAIDFENTPGAWRWLRRNASRFGFRNYAPEPWHYSLNGS